LYATVTGPDGRLLPDLPRGEAFHGPRQRQAANADAVRERRPPIHVVMLLEFAASACAPTSTLVEQAGTERFVDAPASRHDKARIGSFSNRHSGGPP
jgi:hypothetical protein